MKTIELSEKVIITDPMYEEENGWNLVLNRIKSGKYNVEVEVIESGKDKGRITKLIVRHIDHADCKVNQSKGGIGVDSCQVGIFSMETFRNDKVFEGKRSVFAEEHGYEEEGGDWYGHMCEMSTSDEGWGTYDHGVVTSTGWGDGVYTLKVAMNKNKVVGFEMSFL
jgi:hypothetical protein